VGGVKPQPALRTLDLSGNVIGAAGARAIADVILANATQLDAVILTRGADLPIGQLRRNRLATLNLRQKELVRFCYFTRGRAVMRGLYHYSHTHHARPPTREWWNWL
jgi:hypothetical protein